MHYVDEGEGETLLFVHGTPSWSFEWRQMIRALAPRVRCVAPDLLGFGLSGRPVDGAYTPEWHAERLARFVHRLGLDHVTLVVHDYGGPIGLPLALENPGHVRRLIVMNTFMWSLRGDPAVERASKLLGGSLGRLLYRRLNFSLRVIMPAAFADKKKLTRDLHSQYLAPFPDAESRGAVLWPLAHALLGSDAFYESLWERRKVLEAFPALVIWGTEDPAFPVRHLARWREVLPHARVVELPAGHWPQEEAPAEVVAAMKDFLGIGHA
jgi:haloalkane dehalogenase